MTNAIIENIVSRSTAKKYDAAVTLSDDQIRELVRIATAAATSFHMQTWRFIAVRTPEAKARLRPIAWYQPMVTDAVVTFIIWGQLADSSVNTKGPGTGGGSGHHAGSDGAGLGKPRTQSVFRAPAAPARRGVRTGAVGATAMIYMGQAQGANWRRRLISRLQTV